MEKSPCNNYKMKNYSLFIICFALIFGCKNSTKDISDFPDHIDYDKIDNFMGNDVSKLSFNHLYVVLDSLSYSNFMKNNTWHETYASVDNGLPNFSAIDSNTTTCYLRGHKHYIEILGPNNRYNEPVGKSGIGFALNNHNEHFHLGIKPKLKKDSISFLSLANTVKMNLNNKEETWFKAFYTPSEGTAIHTWYGFYNPSFLDHFNSTSHKSYSRELFLKQAYNDQKLFNGIQTITMLCTADDFERIGQEMRYLGQKLRDRDADTLVIAGGDINIKIVHSDSIEYSHITHIECRLNDANNSGTQLGHIHIKNDGKISVWNLSDLYHSNITKN